MVRVPKRKQKKETVMEQDIHITLRYNLAIGNVSINEIVYRLKELRDHLMLSEWGQALQKYGGQA